MEEKMAGLLLQAIPYLGKKKILKVLTDGGMLTLITSNNTALTAPFIWGEWVYLNNKKEIHPLVDGTLLDPLLSIKKSYDHLVVAGKIAQDLLKTQYPGKPARDALTLALACLRKLDLFSEPLMLLGVFRLKLLLAEGLLDPTPFTSLLTPRSFSALAAIPKDEGLLRQVDLLFTEYLGG